MLYLMVYLHIGTGNFSFIMLILYNILEIERLGKIIFILVTQYKSCNAKNLSAYFPALLDFEDIFTDYRRYAIFLNIYTWDCGKKIILFFSVLMAKEKTIFFSE